MNSDTEKALLPYKVWTCKIVVPPGTSLPPGFDLPPRGAAMEAVEKVAPIVSCLSGWGGALTQGEREVVDEDYARMEPKPEPKRGVAALITSLLDIHTGVSAGAGNPGCQCWHCRYGRDILRLYHEEGERVANVARRMREFMADGPCCAVGERVIPRWADELERRDG